MGDTKTPWVANGDDSDWSIPKHDSASVSGAAPIFDATCKVVAFAVNVGWNDEDSERRGLIVHAVNSLASHEARIAELEEALREAKHVLSILIDPANGHVLSQHVFALAFAADVKARRALHTEGE